jgi:hypothetical protein
MGGWNDWIYVVPAPHPATHRPEEVEREVNAELASALEARLRGRVDVGVDLGGGTRAHAVRVAAEGNRLVIDEGKDHGVQEAPARRRRRARPTIEDLFHTSLAEPHVLEDGRVAFRVLTEEDLFGADRAQDEMVDRTAQEILNEQFSEAFERAVKKVELAHPADKAR